MEIIGEKINTTRKAVEAAVRQRDAAFIQDLARRQAEAGAAYLPDRLHSVRIAARKLRYALEVSAEAAGMVARRSPARCSPRPPSAEGKNRAFPS